MCEKFIPGKLFGAQSCACGWRGEGFSKMFVAQRTIVSPGALRHSQFDIMAFIATRSIQQVDDGEKEHIAVHTGD
jgi:hypothetical protein